MRIGRKIAGLILAGAMAGAIGIGAGGMAEAVTPARAASPTPAPPVTNFEPFGYYRIVNPITNKCVDVKGRSLNAGAGVHQWRCNGQDNQRWRVVPSPTASGWYWLMNARSGKCLDIRSTASVPANGTGTKQETCGNAQTQNWTMDLLVVGADPTYGIRSRQGGVCLDLNDGTEDDEGRIQVWQCQPPFNNHQYWKLLNP